MHLVCTTKCTLLATFDVISALTSVLHVQNGVTFRLCLTVHHLSVMSRRTIDRAHFGLFLTISENIFKCQATGRPHDEQNGTEHTIILEDTS